jgi:hypothetical protein
MIALKAQGRSLRAIAAELRAKGHQISHVGVQDQQSRVRDKGLATA